MKFQTKASRQYAHSLTSEQANEWYNDKADQWSNSGIWS